MNIYSFFSTLGSELIAAEHLGIQVEGVYAVNETFAAILRKHFPELTITTTGVPNKSVEIFCSRTPGPPRHIGGRKPIFDTDYLDLALQSISLAKKLGARWLVWETNSRFLTVNHGADFTQYLVQLEKLGYGFAYRVLNAKYFGIPQRRRSLFLVGYSGNWRPPIPVLFDQQTKEQYNRKDKQKPFPVRACEEIDYFNSVMLPYKVINTYLYSDVPSLPEQRKVNEIKSPGSPFILLQNREKITRFLSPNEYERAQGLCDEWTAGHAVDKRYELISNTGAVPIYLWLFKRILTVSEEINNLGV